MIDIIANAASVANILTQVPAVNFYTIILFKHHDQFQNIDGIKSKIAPMSCAFSSISAGVMSMRFNVSMIFTFSSLINHSFFYLLSCYG